MPTLTLALLGEPRLRTTDGPVVCPSKKALGLFCYLALTGTRQARRDLAQLFWGGGNPDAARASLRTALLRLPAPLAQCLTADRDSIVLDQSIDLDTARFSQLTQSTDVTAMAEAAALYGGELLKGLEIDATPQFDDWLARERARWRQAVQALFDKLIERHRERARLDAAHAAVEREAAMATARRWCELEPAAEDAHRWLIRLYLDAGRPDAALAQYDTCRRELAVAAGRAPGAATHALIEPLLQGGGAASAGRAETPAVAGESALAVPDLPGTSFFGRVEELAALEQLLLDPACRLLTLQALGGMGKTRLASVLANQVASRFAQGAAWVPLESITSAAHLPQAIAHALQIDLPPQQQPAVALCHALQQQHRLLVLDNFEHLLVEPATRDGDAVELVLALLREAPRVRLLATSREVLGVQEEWIYELRGLPYPGADAAPQAGGGFAATELFAQRARQAYAGFSPQAEWPHMVRLCQLVDGMPLALELAAAWVRTVPCGDLVSAIETEARAMASRHRNRPERHRNLDAVVRTSWTLLNREQQRALAPLAVFVGGFTQEAAAAVADAPLRVLSALVDKSLVHRRSDGRLGLHELVRQFLHETLQHDAARAREALQRHTTWFAELLTRHRALLDSAQGLDAHIALTRELPNLTAAAARWEFPAQADTLAEPWLVVLNGRGLQRQALPFADAVLAHADRLRPGTRARLLVQRGVARIGMGDAAGGDADFAAAVALSTAHGLAAVLAIALVHRVLTGMLRDDVNEMQAQLDALKPLLGQIDDAGTQVRARFYEALANETRGRNAEAAVQLRDTLALAMQLQVSQQIQATLQSVLARAELRLGRFDAVEPLLSAALPVHERAGNRPRLAQALTVRAEALLGLGGQAHAQQAADDAQRALALHEQSGHPPGISAASHVRALALQALGRLDEARALLRRAAEITSPLLQCEALVDLGLLELEAGAPDAALPIARRCLDIALAQSLPSLRWGATLLACACLVQRHAPSPPAARWLAALQDDRDLSFDYRQRARSLATAAGPLEAGDAPRPIDDDALRAMRNALDSMA